MNPEAFYDCLKLCNYLEKPLDGVSKLEIHKFCFLACILSMYKGKPVAEWGYKFVRTKYGTPYSRELDQSIEFLCNSGRIHLKSGRIHLDVAGRQMFDLLAAMENSKIRDPFLEAAAISALAVPPGIVMRGLDNEPTTRSAASHSNGGPLLEGPALQLLHDHFHGLATVFPLAGDDLVTPSMAWLCYVAEEQLSRRDDMAGAVA